MSVGQEPGVFFLQKGEFLVNIEIADFFEAGHAQRDEAIAWSGFPKVEGEVDELGIELYFMGIFGENESFGFGVGCPFEGQGNCKLLAAAFQNVAVLVVLLIFNQQQVVAVDHQTVGGREKLTSGFAVESLCYLLGHFAVEAVGTQQLKKHTVFLWMFAQEAQGNQMGVALLCHPFVAQLFHFRIEKGRKFAQVVEVVLHGGKKGGIEFLEQGLYLVADFVAYKQGFAVGGVFSPGECAFFTELANLIGRSKKQGPDKLLAPVIHAGQSPYPVPRLRFRKKVSMASLPWWPVARRAQLCWAISC